MKMKASHIPAKVEVLVRSKRLNAALRGSLLRALRHKMEAQQPNWRAYSDFSRGMWSDDWGRNG